jgi:hypothetical protein
MVVAGLREAQLGANASYMLLDGPFGDPQTTGDAGIRATLRPAGPGEQTGRGCRSRGTPDGSPGLLLGLSTL